MTKGYRWRVTAVVALGLFMAILDNTIVSVTLPQMQKAFHTDFETITWVATAYFLAQAAIIPIVGYLSDRVGSKMSFLTALAVFTIGSALCAIAPTKEDLFAFRIFQGIGGGALLPLAFAIIYRIFPPAERGVATAVIGIPVMVAPAFGPTIGGFLSTDFAWNAIFTINIPIGVVALILAILVLPGRKTERENRVASGNSFDILGLVLSMAGFTSLVYGITKAGSKGWGDATVLTFIIAGIAVLAVFAVVELLAKDPVMDLRLLANYTFTIANIGLWVVAAVLFGSLFLLPFFFENIQGNTALTAGEFLIGQGLAMGIAMAISGTLYNRVGPRILSVVGLVCIAAGTYGLTQLNLNSTGQSLQIWLVLRGLGMGFTMPALQTLTLSVVSNKAMAKASSLVTVTRMVAGAIGVAGLTTYLTQQTANHGREAIASCLHSTLSTCPGQHAAVLGLTDTFWVVTIFCIATIVLALILGRDPAIEAFKQAKARGEEVELERVPAMSD